MSKQCSYFFGKSLLSVHRKVVLIHKESLAHTLTTVKATHKQNKQNWETQERAI